MRAIAVGISRAPVTDDFISGLDIFVTAIEYLNYEPGLPVLKRLAKMNMPTEAGERLKDRALDCIKRIGEYAAQQRANRTLLRPSSAAHVGSESLLRPAHHSPPKFLESLLRPSNPDSDEM
jgi:hypothetical protein